MEANGGLPSISPHHTEALKELKLLVGTAVYACALVLDDAPRGDYMSKEAILKGVIDMKCAPPCPRAFLY